MKGNQFLKLSNPIFTLNIHEASPVLIVREYEHFAADFFFCIKRSIRARII